MWLLATCCEYYCTFTIRWWIPLQICQIYIWVLNQVSVYVFFKSWDHKNNLWKWRLFLTLEFPSPISELKPSSVPKKNDFQEVLPPRPSSSLPRGVCTGKTTATVVSVVTCQARIHALEWKDSTIYHNCLTCILTFVRPSYWNPTLPWDVWPKRYWRTTVDIL